MNLKDLQGKKICIIGKNGSGKTTYVKRLFGLMENQVQIADLNLGIVFQNPENNFICPIVYDDIAFGLENYNFKLDEIDKEIKSVASDLQISHLLERSISTLSGGEKQRVAIAGIIAIKPKVIVLDEVTSMLDPINKKIVVDLIHYLNKQHGITTISITHDYEEAVNADEVILIEDKVLKKKGKPLDILNLLPPDMRPYKIQLYNFIKENYCIDFDFYTMSEKEMVNILWI